jgi:serine/threonine protein phosphatase 1
LALLETVAPAADDSILAVGDLVDRGPDSERVLEFFRDQPGARSIMGNHEYEHIEWSSGRHKPSLSQRICREQLADRYDGWLHFMRTLPTYVELPDAIIAHGMLEPGVPLEQQREDVILGTASGEKHMTARYARPWYDLYNGPKPLIVGHHYYGQAHEPLIREGRLYAIDTGCAHGGRLTALILPEFRLVSVKARRDYWMATQWDHALRSPANTDVMDLDWKTLAIRARSAETDNLSAEQREQCRRCEGIVSTSEKLLAWVKERCEVISRAILVDLHQAGDWDTLSSRQQATRYLSRVQKHPAARLLLLARAGRLSRQAIRNICKAPRGLTSLALLLDDPHVADSSNRIHPD